MERFEARTKEGAEVLGERADDLRGIKVKQWVEYVDGAAGELVERLNGLKRKIDGRDIDPESIPVVLRGIMDGITKRMVQLERMVDDRDLLRGLRVRFHQRTDSVLSKSYLFNRARTWPQGYQGDYKTLETIYRNIPLSDGLGYYLDAFALGSKLAVAVRNRIRLLGELLKKELRHRQRPQVLNIACGSCRELLDIVPEILSSGARFTCLDSDEDALTFAQSRITYTDALPQVSFVKYNAGRLFDPETAERDFGPQDIVYSVGFFDYLPTDFLVKMFGSLHSLLRPGGRLIAAFKDADRYTPQEYHWFVDWDGFLQRTEDDFVKIFDEARIPRSSITSLREGTGAVIFYIVAK